MKSFRSLMFGAAALALSATATLAAFEFDAMLWRTYTNEFDRYAAADWTLTTVEAGAGSATEALTSVDGGALLITNDAADDDSDFFQLPSEGFKFDATKRLYFKARFQVSDATQSDFVVGLQITDTTPLAVTDGIYFRKDDDDALLDFVVIKDSTATTATGIATVVDATFVTVSFYYDPGTSGIQYFVNDVLVGSSVLTNAPDDEELTVSFGLQNGAAAAKTMTMDYLFATKER